MVRIHNLNSLEAYEKGRCVGRILKHQLGPHCLFGAWFINSNGDQIVSMMVSRYGLERPVIIQT